MRNPTAAEVQARQKAHAISMASYLASTQRLINEWFEEVLHMRTITIELRMDDDGDPERSEQLLLAAKTAAKHLLTVASLIAGKRKPQIKLQTGDMFSSAEEVFIGEDEINEAPTIET